MAAAVGLAAGSVVADHAAGADEAGVEELLGELAQAALAGASRRQSDNDPDFRWLVEEDAKVLGVEVNWATA
jgi:hypothetical protein